MWLIPYEQLEIRTYLNPDQVQQKLNGAIRPNRPMFSFGSSDKPFYGEITGNHFKVRRIISYKNSFLPSIEGEVQPDGSGSIINMTIQIRMRTLVFALLFFLGVAFFIFDVGGVLIDFFRNPELAKLVSVLEGFFWLGFMFIVAYVIILFSYQFEALKAKSFFRGFFDESVYY